MFAITEVGRDDFEAQRRWYEVMSAGWTDGRPHGQYQPFEAVRAGYADQPPHERLLWLAATEDDRVVGAAELTMETEVNLDRAYLELAVAADRRRRGIGRALWDAGRAICAADGRQTLGGELYVEAGAEVEQSAGYRFAAGLGYRRVHTELHLVLPLPPEPALIGAARAAAASASDGYTALSWTDRCPDEYVGPFLAMRTQMDADAPAGEAPPEHRPWTPERLRAGEERRQGRWTGIVAVARHDATGELSGYSELLVPVSGDGSVWQDDTLVMPAHRGHRLGLLLKLTTLDVLLRDFPAARTLHTWTAPTNTAMLRTNREFGYQDAETMLELLRES